MQTSATANQWLSEKYVLGEIWLDFLLLYLLHFQHVRLLYFQ